MVGKTNSIGEYIEGVDGRLSDLNNHVNVIVGADAQLVSTRGVAISTRVGGGNSDNLMI